MIEAISNMTIGDIVKWVAAAVVTVSGVIQFAPIKVNPWSWLAKKIGRAINGEVIDKVESLQNEISTVKDDISKIQAINDERDANTHRQRILRFNIELMRGENYTHEYFIDMLGDIDEYERYCENHPEYKNNRAVMAIANIKRVYEIHTQNGDFLGGV